MALVDNCGARCPQTQFQVNAEGKKCQKLLRQFPYRCFLVCHSNMNCTFIICPSYIVLYQCEDSHIGVGATFIVVCRVESTYVT